MQREFKRAGQIHFNPQYKNWTQQHILIQTKKLQNLST
jgi:hypothetical protein